MKASYTHTQTIVHALALRLAPPPGTCSIFFFRDQTGSVFVFWGQTTVSPLAPWNRTRDEHIPFIEPSSALSLKIKPLLLSFSPRFPSWISSFCRQRVLTLEMLLKSHWALKWSASFLSLRAVQLQHKPRGKPRWCFFNQYSVILLTEALEYGLYQQRFVYWRVQWKSEIWYLKSNARHPRLLAFYLFHSTLDDRLAGFRWHISYMSFSGRLARAEAFTDPFPTSATHLESVESNLQTAVYFCGRNMSSPSQLFHFLPTASQRVGQPFIFPHLQYDLICPNASVWLPILFCCLAIFAIALIN